MPTQPSAGASYFGITPQPYQDYFQPVVGQMPSPPGTDSPQVALASQELSLNDLMRQRRQQSYDTLNNLDPQDPNSIPAIDRMIGLGQLSPSQGNSLLRSFHYLNPTSGKRNTPYSDEGTAFLNDFNSLDWSDPRNAQKELPGLLQKYPTAVSDPRVATSLNTFQQHLLGFKPPKSIDDSDWQQRLKTGAVNGVVKATGDLAKFATNFGGEQSAPEVIANRRGISSSLKRMQLLGLRPDEIQTEMASAGLDPDEWDNGTGPASPYTPTDDEKTAALKAKGIDVAKATPDQWKQAHYWAQGATSPQAGVVPSQPQAAPQAPAQASVPQIHSQADYNALPSGASYIDSHGTQARKK